MGVFYPQAQAEYHSSTMSIARQLFHDLRPLIRMLEEPLSRSSTYYGLPSRSLFDDPFSYSQAPALIRPAMDVTEEGNNYILEADLPGVKKEDIEVRIGDGGRSVTIEGKTVHRRSGSVDGQTNETSANTNGADAEGIFLLFCIPETHSHSMF